MSGIGKLALTVLETAKIVLGVLTLNRPLKELEKVKANVIDFVGGAILLPLAIVANIVKGVVGTTLYPGIMIRTLNKEENALITKDSNDLVSYQLNRCDKILYALGHPFLCGTLVNK